MSVQPQAQLDRRTEYRAILLIYSAAFSYQLTLGLITVLVPLYALHLGYDLTLLGVIVASQAVFGLMLRLFAGAIADQFGERWVLWVSFVTMVTGMVLFVVSGVFWMLILAQSFVGYSRATYWTATQSYVSRINPERSGEVYGRLNGAGNAGGLIGAFLSGVLVATLGYGAAFGFTGAVALAGFLGSIALPPLAARPTRRGFREPLGQIPSLARHRGMGLGGFAAFAASTAMILPSVLFIPYLRELDYSEAVTGGMQAVSVGSSIAVGIVFGHILGRLGRRWTYTIAMAMAGLTVLGISVGAGAYATLVPLMLLYGLFRASVSILYPISASDHSATNQRGMAMAYVGLYWGTAQLVVPVGFGALAGAVDLRASLWAAGALFLVAGAFFPMLYRWFVPGAERTFGERP
ncbi:MAG: MFS transporter [Chloroflexota bacterium]|nr:MFS transporter [Chloroflexota bacterium]MDE2883901.1 MFS transporter [Chloroflexota bacterium]